MEQSNIEKDKDIERLNQNNASKDKDIEKLTQMVNTLTIDLSHIQNTIPSIICNGVYVWRFENFKQSLKLMKEKPLLKHYYSSGFYTSSAGYK